MVLFGFDDDKIDLKYEANYMLISLAQKTPADIYYLFVVCKSMHYLFLLYANIYSYFILFYFEQIHHVWDGHLRKIPVERKNISRAERRRKFCLKTGIFRKYPSQYNISV